MSEERILAYFTVVVDTLVTFGIDIGSVFSQKSNNIQMTRCGSTQERCPFIPA
jgi:hypothetical protein